MFTPVTVALYALTLVAAVWALVKLVGNKPFLLKTASDQWLFRLIVVIEIVVVAQAVIGFAAMFAGDRDIHRLTFSAYLVGLLFIVPVGTWWALGDRSRGGTGVLIVANLTLAAMVLRLTNIWDGYA
ncbi:hypothetical protein GCM10007304_03170 [Rhodococcoides trifolii]|uniref:Uncharacterized protein n=1 Tax=Rhodococcoides trifolii TaxID=908250 RepID=A0A917CP18_9NOCA|nr:hypothetical protein [Rhodococcus trifolii]GGF92689.1 hypothetical protein GCM10007304_03170 [Rhodococcus trifolii]